MEQLENPFVWHERGKCPIYYTLEIVGGKWKWAILFKLAMDGVIRYGKLKEFLPPIAHKTLSQQLKELESSGIIHREQYNVMPPKVEYSLTEKGKTLIPMLEMMAKWGREHMAD
ncbi:helix-turn-helix transcriptional regulator [Paenibacillus sp. P26]|nr:helix-turn-helix transcriptional regulator [Paenibacillus sp. P26]